MKLFSFEILNTSLEKLFLSFSNESYFTFLDGQDEGHTHSQFGFMGFDPIKIYNECTTSFHEIYADFLEYKPQNSLPTEFPFTGGLMGFLSYEFGYECNDIKNPFEADQNFPLYQFGLYNKIVAINHTTQKYYLFVTTENEDSAKNIYSEFLQKLSGNCTSKTIADSIKLQPQLNKNYYTENIQKVINYIFEGDIFQANLAQQFSSPIPQNILPQSIYLKSRINNSAPYSSYIHHDGFYILSSSPESFLSLRNNILETRPIKGTAPDTSDSLLLQNSEKDRAENIMIVDLMRNDLSKICEDSSIQVTKLCEIETFKGLHHMVSTVSGSLKPNTSIFDALWACFPGGSITGAPKIRAMEIIAELEQPPRNIFCGSIGYISYNMNAEFCIAIRTLLIHKNEISLWAGGGITSLSNAEDEYNETLLKSKKWHEILKA